MTKEEIIMLTIRLEGGYVDNKNDSGGETKFGISKRQYPDVDIKNLTEQDAVEIYKRDYYDAKLDLIASDIIKSKVFDTGVNMGKRTAIKLLQGCVDSEQDGILGDETIRLVNAGQEEEIHEEFRKAQLLRYANIIKKNPSQIEFLAGWINRTFAT
jgi:lysozyme family protein